MNETTSKKYIDESFRDAMLMELEETNDLISVIILIKCAKTKRYIFSNVLKRKEDVNINVISQL